MTYETKAGRPLYHGRLTEGIRLLSRYPSTRQTELLIYRICTDRIRQFERPGNAIVTCSICSSSEKLSQLTFGISAGCRGRAQPLPTSPKKPPNSLGSLSTQGRLAHMTRELRGGVTL
jgi:hypothetical protein